MNPFKINQNLTFNIFAFSGYVLSVLCLLHLANHEFADLETVFLFFLPAICLIIFYPCIIFLFILEIIIKKKILWKFTIEYRNSWFSKAYFFYGILLHIYFCWYVYDKIIGFILMFM